MKIKRDKLDSAFSDYIRARDGWRCRRCKAPHRPENGIQCAHIFTRANKGIRVDEDNALALCKACHCYFTFRKEEWTAWCEKTLGKAFMDRLRVKYYGRGRKLVDSEKELLRQDFIKRTKALNERVL